MTGTPNEYTKESWLSAITKADGKRISYTYDKTGLLTGADYAGEGSIDNSYNELGLLTVTKGMEGTTSYQYNEDGKLLSVATPDGDTVSYTYNEKGLKAGITYPDGSQVQYAYDSMGRLGSVTGLDGGITEYEYDAAGRRTKTVSENRTITYTYDEGNRLTGLNVAGDVQLSFGYTYDKNGSMTSETLSGDGMDTTSRYTYDLAGQLTGFSRTDGYEECYAYDPAGNMTERICKAQGGEVYALSMAYDQADRLVRMERAAKERKITGIVYRYDENGNLTSKTSDIGTDTYHYNAMDQLTSYEGYDGYQAKYAYQDTGVLLRKETKGNLSRLTQEEVLEGKSVSGEIDIEEGAAGIGAADMGSQIDAGDWIVTSYVYDINQEYEQVLSETTQGQTTCYEYGLERISAYGPDGKTDYLYDGRGSVAEQLTTGTDLAENVKKVIKSYNPYGEQLNEKLSGFGYNGEEYDRATGTVYLRARWYEPAMARFAQKDIERGHLTDTISQNRYLYAANDPVNYTDPSGEFKLPIINPLKTIGNGIRNKLPDPLKSVYDYGVKFVSTLAAPVKQLADTVVATGELISSVYHKNKMEAGNQQDYVVLNTIIETLGIWDKVNSGDMKNAPLQERLKYACGISDEEYQKARKYYQENNLTWINDLLTDEKELNTRYENLKKKIKATGGISLYDLTPAEIAVLEKKLGKTITGDVNTLFPKIETGLGVADDGSNGVLGTAFNDDKKLTLKMIDVLEEQKRQADASMPVLYKTLFIIVLAATGVASVYALGTTGAIEAGLAAINSIIVEYGSQGGGMILSYAGAYNEYGEQVGYEVEVVAEGVSGIDIAANLGLVATINYSVSKNGNDTSKKPTSQNQMQKQVEKGQAPREVDRVDSSHTKGQQPHIHFKDGTAINQDGTVHDLHKGIPNITNEILKWLEKNGWKANK